jgi:6-pyruvoyltetrahydropterin/6-carboxytetrahydropterin synthase
MMYITKSMSFSASHRLHNPELSDEENLEIYDKCNNPNGHGHNYKLEVTVVGMPNEKIGYVIDLKLLKKIIEDEVVSHVDHKHLNFDVEFLKDIIPSVENLAKAFWKRLDGKIPDVKLYSIKLYETETSWVEYFGEKENV